MSNRVNLPHLRNALLKVARDLREAVSNLLDVDIEFSLGISVEGLQTWTGDWDVDWADDVEVKLILSAPGVEDFQIVAPSIAGQEHYSPQIQAALLPAAGIWIQAAALLATARNTAQLVCITGGRS